jgi:hypothetical protein
MYAIGENLDLAALDTRATALFDAIWKPLPEVIGSTWQGQSSTSSTRVSDVPTHLEGDLLIAVVMWRDAAGVITAPAGWELHGAYTESIVSTSGGNQRLYVYTKTATNSEPADYTWNSATSSVGASFMVSVRGGVIDTVTENYGNATTATIEAVDDRLNLCAFTWVFNVSSPSTNQTQSVTGTGVTAILESPSSARLTGGYTTVKGTVTSTQAATTTTGDPNHGGINIQIVGA